MRVSNASNRQFAVGFVTAIVLIIGTGYLVQAVGWLLSRPQPAAIIELLQQPMFSILDIVAFASGIFVLALVLTVPVWGPKV